MTYKELALLIDSEKYSDYVKAQIYLESRDVLFDLPITEELLDRYIHYGFKVWEQTDYTPASAIGEAIRLGLYSVEDNEYNNIEDVTTYGFSLLGGGYE
jgi:hypothetical protein